MPIVYLIAGLGNPGKKYEGTKHNMGFDTISYLADKYRIPSSGVSMKGVYGKGRINGQSVILLKPMTYMNHSGVRSLLQDRSGDAADRHL